MNNLSPLKRSLRYYYHQPSTIIITFSTINHHHHLLQPPRQLHRQYIPSTLHSLPSFYTCIIISINLYILPLIPNNIYTNHSRIKTDGQRERERDRTIERKRETERQRQRQRHPTSLALLAALGFPFFPPPYINGYPNKQPKQPANQ